MTTYKLNQVPEDDVAGQISPSLIPGHEFDMPIAQSNHPEILHSSSTTTDTLNSPQPRGPTPSSHRPRPLSMPPQSYTSNTPATVVAGNSTATHDGSDNKERYQDENSQRRRHREDHPPSSKPSRSNRILGDYTLSKTLGAGSMGKVKLATHNITGEKLAVKILPRVHPNPPPSANGSGVNADSASRQASKDASKEIRTLREAALSMLLYHPYICGMREMIIHQHHYYMVFEYVNGGQMLDYIISHGRLRERVARKFARQIGSALEYCHLNNVVHRDLKIENILISQTGNIKIIDFGLSNLYDPITNLSTFCGSLYFAAPELLNARVYTGPEVDVWSFGVVLYVLVCGKVPFDDQSMPALHAKIKRGLVEYPVWLSAECKHLLSRMLVTNPAARATLQEVMSHSWMVRGFSGPPAIHLVHREPLRADELDRQVIKGMKGFEFGTEDEIERRLVQVLESEPYIRAVQYWERKRNVGGNLNGNGSNFNGSRWGESVSNSSLAISFDSHNSGKNDAYNAPKKTRRFSGFDYYRRKLFSPVSSPPGTPLSHSPPNSQHHLAHPSFSDPNREPMDPTKGFHPLISMYYLAREKLERDRVYGPGQFASSQLSIHGDAANAAAASVVTPVDEASLRQQQYNSTIQSPHAVPLPPPKRDHPLPSATAKADYTMQLPRLPAPETLHFSGMSYDNTNVPSPTSPTFNHPQPRARDLGLPPPSPSAQARQHIEIEQPTLGAKRNLPRAPPASTHRRSHSMSQRPTVLSRGWGGIFGTGDDHGVNTIPETPKTVGPDTSNFPERLDDDHDRLSAFTSGATLVRKFGSLLVGRGDDMRRNQSGTLKRGTLSGGPMSSPRPSGDLKSATSIPDGGGGDEKTPLPDADGKDEENVVLPTTSALPTSPSKTIAHSISQPVANVHRRAATILDPQGRAVRHERRSSTGAALTATPVGTFGRRRRPSTGYSSVSSKPLAERLFSRIEPAGLVEKREEEEVGDKPRNAVNGGDDGGAETFKEEDERHTTEKDFKPVFLKGLFSVATTSTKAPSVIKTDIRRVLDRMQVQYRETKGGFECIHLPSIDMTSVETSTNKGSHPLQASSISSETSPTTVSIANSRPSIAKKTSKISFTLKRDKGKEKDHSLDSNKDKDRETAGRPSGATTLTATASSGSSSFINVSSNHTVVPSQDKEATQAQAQANGLSVLPSPNDVDSASASLAATVAPLNKTKGLPPIPRDFTTRPASPLPAHRSPSPLPTGEVDRDVFESMGNNSLSVRFEINIVKVPWLPLHGIQFRRASGDGWQYQMLARRVLTELKL
ncbi:Pkinase-domain-containing protein [Phlegmacium glaucopus]|nr:Pkinase-domain-containing protein [Phlegmacium glaucopus]